MESFRQCDHFFDDTLAKLLVEFVGVEAPVRQCHREGVGLVADPTRR